MRPVRYRTPLRYDAPRALLVSGGLGLLAASACKEAAPQSSTETSAPQPPALRGVGTANHYGFTLELEPREPSVGQLFSVLTVVRDAQTNEPIDGAALSVDAAMPEHGHGMMTAPQHRALGNGRYQSDGFKFHMPGRWVFELRTTHPKQDQLQLPFHQPPTVRR